MKIGSSVIDPCGKANVHSPNQSSVPVTLMAGTLNRSSIASRVGTQLSVMCGPNTTQAAFVDEFAEGVDHRLDRSLGQPLNFAIDHLYGPIHRPVFNGLREHEVKAPSEVGMHLLGEPRRKREVHQVADLDRLCAAFVGHLTSRATNLRARSLNQAE